MLVTIYTVSYPKLPAEIARGDARALTAACSKRYTTFSFTMVEEGGGFAVKADLTGHTDSRSQADMFRAFAEGFMASAHLWER